MDLVSEMKVMKTIGKHKNIINLLGVCTQEGNFLLWLGLFTRTSVCIFSIPFSIHFLWCWQREFVQRSRISLLGDLSLYFCDRNVRLKGGIGRRN